MTLCIMTMFEPTYRKNWVSLLKCEVAGIGPPRIGFAPWTRFRTRHFVQATHFNVHIVSPKPETKENKMSAVVDVSSQVVMHPVVSHSLKVWSTTLGRDKVGPAIPLTT